MSKLRKFTLEHNERQDRWNLIQDKSHNLVKSFGTKQQATKGGVLERAIGPDGGSVKIEKMNGQYDEERTYPRSADPPESKG